MIADFFIIFPRLTNMILNKTILILEDDLRTLSKMLERLAVIEEDQPYDFALVVLTSYLQVQEYINDHKKVSFDIILLDRDCKLGGSFHVLNFERLGPEKVIAISSVPKWNEEAKKRGVTRVVPKDYRDLDTFAAKVADEVSVMLKGSPVTEASMHHIFDKKIK